MEIWWLSEQNKKMEDTKDGELEKSIGNYKSQIM